ncbi:MAG: WD40/YVTN/BNR-like repeat-containing protein, partial [Blastocatellia bacterium]
MLYTVVMSNRATGILGRLAPALFVLVLLSAEPTNAQWNSQASHSTARLRGISAVIATVAWASGTGGAVLRTTDEGETWIPRPVPGAGSLDFRDIEAFDSRTAYVLSIGEGDKSRIYKTTDGGVTWTLQFTNHN